MRRLFIAAAAMAVLAGCTSTVESEEAVDSGSTSTTEATQPGERIDPKSIESMEEGIAWARALDDTAAADELSLGIERITDHLLDEEIEFETSNEIGQSLMALQGAVESAPDTAGAKVPELAAIADRIESAIAAGATD